MQTKRRQDKGNITETATETCGQNGDKRPQNAYRKFMIWSATWFWLIRQHTC